MTAGIWVFFYTPEVRVGFGVALGAVLASIGFREQREARWYAQLMLGGAAATWYITGFAAYQFLNVVSHATAFGFMVLVTLYAIGTGVRQNQAVLTVLGAMGGLGTPFHLYTDAQSIPRLMLYTTLVLSGTSAVYLVKGWRVLLWVTAIGTWMVLMQGFPATTPADRTALQGGILAAERLLLTIAGRLRAGGLLKMLGAVDQAAEKAFEFTPWTPVFNATGQPAMSVPLEWNAEGLPIGVHFVARFGDEAMLFRLAGQLERERPWWDRRPRLVGAPCAPAGAGTRS